MHHAVEFKSLEPKEPIRQLVENLIGWLDRKSRNLPPEVLFLRCIVEEIPAHKLYRVTVTLSVPGKTLAATNQTHEVTDTVRTVFAEIERQLEAYKADLRGEPWWKRLARRYKLRLQKAGLQSAEAYEAPSAESEPHAVREMQPAFEKSEASQFFQLVRPHIDKLNHFVRHVLLQAEARGDLAMGEVAPEDIVDAALIRAYNEFTKKPDPETIRAQLIRFAIKEIEDEIKWAKRDRSRAIHVEEDIPETPPSEEVSTLGDEILDFYQPDEDLKAEDVIPDIEVSSPEEELARAEFQKCVQTALKAIPKEYRRALIFRYVLELSGRQLEHALAKPRQVVERWLEKGRESLREQLVAAGCTFKGAGDEANMLSAPGAALKRSLS